MTKHIIGLVAALVGAASFGETIYENDFSERRSASSVPTAEWRVVDYVTGLLANTNSAAPLAPTAEGQVMQDGWIMSQEANNKGNARVYADGGNNMATLGHEDGDHAQLSFVKQRLGTTFTDGVVTVQFDFLPPGSWAGYNDDRRAALSIGDEGFYSPSVSQDKVYQHTVGSVGVRLNSDKTPSVREVYYNANQDAANTGTTDKEVTRYAWHRAVVTIDLDARKWGFSMYEMGQHPALGAATPATAVYTASGLSFADDSVKSVSSIGLGGFGVVWSAGGYASGQSPTHIAAFDNIRVAHNGVECYVNDFSSGRRRNLGGTTSGAYTPDSLLTSRVGNDVYVSGKNIVGDFTGGSVVQPLGVDSWRRTMHGAGTARAYVSSTTDYTVLRCEGSAKTEGVAYVTHPFGTTVSSGKVKIQVDVRTHSSWAYNDKYLNTAWLTLGDEAHYNATPSDAPNHRFTSVGIRATSPTEGSPLYKPPSDTMAGTATNAIAKSKWYRMVVTADIDNGKVVYKLYDQGEASPNSATADGTLLYTSPEFDQLNSGSVKSLSCFSLGTYFCTLYFDNIKVWHTPTGSSDETLLYENYFSARTYYHQDKRVAKLAGTMLLNPEGQDGWTRLNSEGADVFVTDADNPAVAFARYSSDSFVAHDIGRNVKTGTLTVQADMRPPKGWQFNGGSVYLRLAGDAHIQSSIRNDDTYFLKNIATGFGFRNVGTGKKDNIYTNSTIAAYRGDLAGGGAFENEACVVDPTHWYRFVATARVAESKYDVAVYDMGATQPTLATATPASPVATFSKLPFRRSRRDLGGISCYGLSVNRTLYSSVDDTLGPLVDNVRITHEQGGFTVILR